MKTNELTGPALDWAVAKCEGLPLKLDPMGFRKDAPTSIQAGWWVWDGEGQNQVIGHRKTSRYQEEGYSPSTDWAQGGPIIEREDIAMSSKPDGLWAAYAPKGTRLVQHGGQAVEVFNWTYKQCGYTPLIAAMRCYVASKLGDDIELPKELT